MKALKTVVRTFIATLMTAIAPAYVFACDLTWGTGADNDFTSKVSTVIQSFVSFLLGDFAVGLMAAGGVGVVVNLFGNPREGFMGKSVAVLGAGVLLFGIGCIINYIKDTMS